VKLDASIRAAFRHAAAAIEVLGHKLSTSTITFGPVAVTFVKPTPPAPVLDGVVAPPAERRGFPRGRDGLPCLRRPGRGACEPLPWYGTIGGKSRRGS